MERFQQQSDTQNTSRCPVDTQKYNPNKVIVNYLPDALTDEELSSLFSTIGPLKSTKIVRDKVTMTNLGFGFVEFESEDDAARAIEKFNGLNLQQKRLRVAYARWPGTPETVGVNVHVRNLETTVSVEDVEQQFSQFGEIVRARVLYDHKSGDSRGIAFILFGNREDAERAVNKLNGANISGFTRGPLCVRFAIDNNTKAQAMRAAATAINPGGIGGFPFSHPMLSGYQNATAAQHLMLGAQYGSEVGGGPIRAGNMRQRFNPLAAGMAGGLAGLSNSSTGLIRSSVNPGALNTAFGVNSLNSHLHPLWAGAAATSTQRLQSSIPDHPITGAVASPGFILFVYNLEAESDDRDLWQLFAPFGAVQKVNVIMDQEKNKTKGYGFVTMTHLDEAMLAIANLNGFLYKGKQLQVSLKTPKQRVSQKV